MEASTFEIIGEVLAFILLLITIFVTYGRAIRDYTNLKSRVAALENDYAELRLKIEDMESKRIQDYNKIMSTITRLDLKNVEANAKQFEKLSEQIDNNFKILLDKKK